MAYTSSYIVMMIFLYEMVQNCYGCIYVIFIINMVMKCDDSIYACFS